MKQMRSLNPPLIKDIFMQRNISNCLSHIATMLNFHKYEERPLELGPLFSLAINPGKIYRKKQTIKQPSYLKKN